MENQLKSRVFNQLICISVLTDCLSLTADNDNRCRFSMGIVSYQGLIYIVGGCTHSRRHMQELVSYNPVTRQSISMAELTISGKKVLLV